MPDNASFKVRIKQIQLEQVRGQVYGVNFTMLTLIIGYSKIDLPSTDINFKN